jgi:hypothetical protein
MASLFKSYFASEPNTRDCFLLSLRIRNGEAMIAGLTTAIVATSGFPEYYGPALGAFRQVPGVNSSMRSFIARRFSALPQEEIPK